MSTCDAVRCGAIGAVGARAFAIICREGPVSTKHVPSRVTLRGLGSGHAAGPLITGCAWHAIKIGGSATPQAELATAAEEGAAGAVGGGRSPLRGITT